MYAYELFVDPEQIDNLSIPLDIKNKIRLLGKAKLIILFDDKSEESDIECTKENPLYKLIGMVKEGSITDGSINHDRDIYR